MREQHQLSLDSIPPEIVLRILEHASAQSIVRLSATCTRLHSIARSETLWRDICIAVRVNDGGEQKGRVRLGGRYYENKQTMITSTLASTAGTTHDDDDESLTECDGEGWWKQASFLLPHSQHLGYWVSSNPYTSRIIRLSTSLAETATSSIPTLTITASQLVARNAYNSLTFPAPPLPVGSRRDGRDHASYLVPRRGLGSNNPDAGLSVDLLFPTYEFRDLFTINESSGALLSTAPYSTSPDRFGQTLRLRLEKVTREVRPFTYPDLTEGDRRRQQVDSMLALFTGRAPVRPWPTEELVGINVNEEPRVRRRGAFRGTNEWLLARGEPLEVVRKVVDVPSPSSSAIALPRTIGDLAEGSIPLHEGSGSTDPRLVVEGFHLQVRRKLTTLPGSFPRSPPRPSFGLFDDLGRPRVGVDPEVPQRLRRGLRAGPDIIWNGGRDDDPEERPGPAIIRAGGEVVGQPGGFVFHLPNDPPTQRVPHDQNEEVHGEEIVRTDREEFYPIEAPASPLAYDTASSAVTGDDEISASSVEGLWVGTYGPHGLEFGYVSIRLIATSDMPRVHPDATVYERRLEFCKVTGDANVPSGQISWTAELPPVELLSPPADQTPLGTIPSVTNESLLRWSAIDPEAPTTNGELAETPRWEQGTVFGVARVASPGFANPGYTTAEIIFIRSSEVLESSCGDGLTKTIDVVEEIRVRWRELGKTSVFRRVRLPASIA